MNDGLIDGFRHNAWATRELIACLRGLSAEQLRTTTEGIYGDPIATLWHIVGAEANYLRRLSGQQPDWDSRSPEQPSLEEIARRADAMAERWEAFLREPFDAEPTSTFQVDGVTHTCPAGVVLAQALHHGTDHRSQICTALTVTGVTPPEIDVWQYALASGRAPRASS